MKLTRKQVGLITDAVGDVFWKLKARLLGRYFKGPSIYFEVARNNELDSLDDLYRYAGDLSTGRSFQYDPEEITALSEVASNYLDAEKHKTLHKILTGIRAAETPAEATKIVQESLENATKYVEMMIPTETRTVQAFAEKSGIEQVASDLGVDDPTVAFLGRYDAKTCKYCRAMYHRQGNPAIPIVYKMSQLQSGYFKPKDWDGSTPYFAPIHPHCRHRITLVPPNFGFDGAGKIVFKGLGYDAYTEQEALGKAEVSHQIELHKAHSCDCHRHPEP